MVLFGGGAFTQSLLDPVEEIPAGLGGFACPNNAHGHGKLPWKTLESKRMPARVWPCLAYGTLAALRSTRLVSMC